MGIKQLLNSTIIYQLRIKTIKTINRKSLTVADETFFILNQLIGLVGYWWLIHNKKFTYAIIIDSPEHSMD